MAGGRLAPFSAVPMTAGIVYPKIFNTGTGSGTWTTVGYGVAASIGSDGNWELLWAMPATIPSGQMKLELWHRTSATTGNAKVEPIWGNVAMGASPATATHTSETVQTIAVAGTANVITQTKVTLDADTIAALEVLSMALWFRTSSWTLAAESVWRAWLIWE